MHGEDLVLDSGYIYLKFTSLHLKELVLTDRPLRQCQSMSGMNEQSDLIVLTLELKEQKYVYMFVCVCVCLPATARPDTGKLLPQRPQRKMLFPPTARLGFSVG